MIIEDCICFEDIYIKILTPYDIHDGYINALNDHEINQYLVNVKTSFQTYDSVLSFININLNSPDCLLFGIWHKNSDDKTIGTIKLQKSNDEIYNIGICLFDKLFWNKKIGSNAIKDLSDWALNNKLCKKIVAGIYLENKASIKSFTQAGFVLYNINSNEYSLNGKSTDVLFFEYQL